MMELKKSPKADLERRRVYFFLIGLFFSSGLLYLVLEWEYIPAVPDVDDMNLITLDEVIEVREDNLPETGLPLPQAAVRTAPQPAATVEIFDVVNDRETVKPIEIISWEDRSDEAVREEFLREAMELDNTTTNDEQIFIQIDEMPEFPGGHQAFVQYLANNAGYSLRMQGQKIEGQVVCSFIINKEGKVIDPAIVRGLATDIDRDALRIVRSMPDWKPGKSKNRPVSVKFIVPVTFSL
jgi:protein TonB